MLAKRLPTILPKLSFEEAIQTTRIYSFAGMLPPDHPIMNTRPFRSPHHTVSPAGLTGGGSSPVPGEISLAHNARFVFGRAAGISAAVAGGAAPAHRRQLCDHLPRRLPRHLSLLDDVRCCHEPLSLWLSRTPKHRLHLLGKCCPAPHFQNLRSFCSTASTCTSRSRLSSFTT